MGWGGRARGHMEPVEKGKSEEIAAKLTGICEKRTFVSPEGKQIDQLVPIEGGVAFFAAAVNVTRQIPGGPAVTAQRPYIIDGATPAEAFANQPNAERLAVQAATRQLDDFIHAQQSRVVVPGGEGISPPDQMAKKVWSDMMRERLRDNGRR